jgi:hypothetical protein
MADIIRDMSAKLRKAQAQQKKQADKKRRNVEFQVGDKVLLSTKNISVDNQKRRPTKKFQPWFIGPYEVIEVVTPVSYRLRLPFSMRIHPVFHVSLLKKYEENPEQFKDRIIPPPPSVKIADEEEFEVEYILDKRIRRSRRQKIQVEYLVKWKGYPEHDATWEPLENLQNASEVIKEFERSGRSL